MDVQMSAKTIKQQREINAIDSVSIARTRQDALANAIDKLHKKLCKPNDVIANMISDKNE